MAAHSTEAELNERAAFVFKGRVRKLKAVTMASVPVTSRTAIVRVDEIIRAPQLLTRYAGREITVRLEPGHKMKEGAAAIFYTTNLVFGDDIAVESIGHIDIDHGPAGGARAAREHGQAEATGARELRDHLAGADMVVTGKVVSVSLPGGTAGRTAAAAGRVSEHSPCWREAVVLVHQVDKGQPAVRRLVVRFPGSNDVAWADAPKFQPGQEGVFILHKAAPEKGAGKSKRAAAEEEDPAQTYTVLHAHDFQPTHDAERIKTLIQAAETKRPARQAAAKKRR